MDGLHTNLPISDGERPIMPLSVPARHNPKLQAVVARINADEELWQLWRCANVYAVDRLGLADHGEVHVRIVANAALKLLRLLREGGHAPSVVSQHHFAPEDAEVIVVLASALHDLGLAMGAPAGQTGGLLAWLKANALLENVYPVCGRAILATEVMHAVLAQQGQVDGLTLESGVLVLADALDIAAGRSHPSADKSSHAIRGVVIRRGKERVVRVEAHLNNPASFPPVKQALEARLRQSTLSGLVEVVALVEGANGARRSASGKLSILA